MEIKKEIGFRLKEIRQALKFTQEEFAKQLNTARTNLAGYENNKIAIPDKFKNILIKKFNINLNYLIAGKGPKFLENNGTLQLPILNTKARPGFGFKNIDNPTILGYFSIEKNILKDYDKEKIVVFQITDDSMTPTFNENDYVLCELGVDNTRNGLFLINIDGELSVKRLQFNKKEKKIIIMSDNKFYHDINVSEKFNEYFAVIGKVFYRCYKI